MLSCLFVALQVVGAVKSNGGAAYVYSKSSGSWSFESLLKPVEGTAGDGFASSLSLYRELVTGIPYLILLGGAPNASAAYVFIYNTVTSVWTQHSRLVGTAGDQFGFSVSAYEDGLAVGAPAASGSTGSVSTFVAKNVSNRVVWSLQSQVRGCVVCKL